MLTRSLLCPSRLAAAEALDLPSRAIRNAYPTIDLATQSDLDPSCIVFMSSRDVTSRLRESVWNGSVPLEVRLHSGDCRTYDDSEPYLVRASSPSCVQI